MGNARQIVAVFLMCGCAAAAEAQPSEPQHVEIGASLGSVLTWFYGGHAMPGGDVRVTVPTGGGRAIEGFIGLTPVVEHATTGFYGLLVKRPLRDQSDPDVEQFFSYGLVGGFSHSRVTDYRNPSVSHRKDGHHAAFHRPDRRRRPVSRRPENEGSAREPVGDGADSAGRRSRGGRHLGPVGQALVAVSAP